MRTVKWIVAAVDTFIEVLVENAQQIITVNTERQIFVWLVLQA